MARLTIAILVFVAILFLGLELRLIWQADKAFIASQSSCVKAPIAKE
jgi:hypothetical protein